MVDNFHSNDELFLDDKAREAAERAYPSVWFALYYEEATELFRTINAKAKRAKRWFRILGLLTAALAFFALSLAAIEPGLLMPEVSKGNLAEGTIEAVAFVAAFAGILSFIIGWAGMGISGRKRGWLKKRLMCESIRRWHSQYICSHVPEIVEAARTPEGRKKYIEKREPDFHLFEQRSIRNVEARLNEHLSDSREAQPEPWLAPDVNGVSGPPANPNGKRRDDDGSALQQLLSAYEDIRLQGQADYTAYYLGEGPLTSHPATQKRVLHTSGLSMVIVTLIFHVAIVIGIIFDMPDLKSHVVHVTAVIAALGALAIRVLEDGLQTSAHLARLSVYAEEIDAARRLFREAAGLQDKLRAMHTLEEASSRDLHVFIKTIKKANYVL